MGAVMTDRVAKTSNVLKAAVYLSLAWFMSAPTAHADTKDTNMRALIAACTEGRIELSERASKIQALGFTSIKSEGEMWLQGQLTHIAMASLQTEGDLRGTYNAVRQRADDGDLFLENLEQYSFRNSTNTIHVNLSAPRGDDPGCSFAFAKGVTSIQMPLRSQRTWTSEAGTYTEYQIGGGRFALSSTLKKPWDTWIKGRRLVSAFIVISK